MKADQGVRQVNDVSRDFVYYPRAHYDTHHSHVTHEHGTLGVDAQRFLEVDFGECKLFLFVEYHPDAVPGGTNSHQF